MADKAFCKSTDGSFGRSITCREGTSRVSVYSSKQNAASSMMEVVQSDQPAIG